MNPQRVYQHNNPGRLIFGPKSVNELANEIPANEIPLVITDQRGCQIGDSEEGDRRFGRGRNPPPYF